MSASTRRSVATGCPRWHRRVVVTPGQKRKRFVAGALNALTGKLAWVGGTSKGCSSSLWRGSSAQFGGARRIHILLDNYVIHASRSTQRFLAQFGDRVVLHFLSPHCPNDHRIERV